MFKRRHPKTYLRIIGDVIYPRGGWSRSVSYIWYRLRRLPDPPHRIARGVAVGVFVCYTPFFGMHFVLAALITWAMQGNIVAALLATFFGNPLTFPIIAAVSMELGHLMLDMPHLVPLSQVFHAFTDASAQLWHNFEAVFTHERPHWDRLRLFYWSVFWPYFVGGLIPGVVSGLIAYLLTSPAVSAYQKARIKRLKTKYQKRQAAALRKG